MLKQLLFTFVFLGISGSMSSYRMPRREVDEDKVKETVAAYTSCLKEYSSCREEGKKADLYVKLVMLKDGTDFQQVVANDLFDGPNKKTLGFESYLDSVDNKYNNGLTVDYDVDNMKVLPCQQDKGPNTFVYVSFEKTLSYNGKFKKVTEVASVNLNNYKIPTTFFPDDTVNASGMCVEQISSIGGANPATPVQPVVVAGSYKTAIKQADQLYKSGQYGAAEDQYAAIGTKFPSESRKDNIERKVYLTKAAIDALDAERAYNRAMYCANYYYNKGIFNKASDFFSYALQYKPNDQFASAGIVKCSENTDLHLIRNQIATARQWEAAPTGYGRAFRIFADLEPSGLLSVADYYFMIENLYQKNPAVINEMHYTEEQCENNLNIYRYKLRLISERERNLQVRGDVIQLLGDINYSYRNAHVYYRRINTYPVWVIHNAGNRLVNINPYRSGYSRPAYLDHRAQAFGRTGTSSPHNTPFSGTHGGPGTPAARGFAPRNPGQHPGLGSARQNGPQVPHGGMPNRPGAARAPSATPRTQQTQQRSNSRPAATRRH